MDGKMDGWISSRGDGLEGRGIVGLGFLFMLMLMLMLVVAVITYRTYFTLGRRS
jgi:hypothetical protein